VTNVSRGIIAQKGSCIVAYCNAVMLLHTMLRAAQTGWVQVDPCRCSDERVNLDGNLVVVDGTDGWYEYGIEVR
jgi:hypothetical protein